MSKFADFGGLPENIFKDFLAAYSDPLNVPGLSDAQRRDALAALADEEHAAATSTKAVDIGALVEQCIAVQAAHLQVVNLGTAAAVTTFIKEIGKLKKLWA